MPFSLNPRGLLLLVLSFSVVTDQNIKPQADSTRIDVDDQQWPRQVSVKIPGDIQLGALMMVHERESEPKICGQVMPQGGVQAVEAMIFTLNKVYELGILGTLPDSGRKLKLGALILDDCDKDTYGLQQAVQFIRDNLLTVFKGKEGDTEDTQGTKEGKSKEKPISAVVAAASSFTSMQVASLLKLFKLPQISYFSTSSELNNTERYPYFYRTIPSDEHQVEAMVALVQHLKWKYVSILYEESSYGKSAYDMLRKNLAQLNVCVAYTEHLPKDSGVGNSKMYMNIVKSLLKNQRARAVIVYGSDQEVSMLMQQVTALGHSKKFTWIGSDGWSARSVVTNGNEEAVHGTISVQPTASPIPGFKEYFQKLRLDHNAVNPWFYEMWELEHNCSLHGKSHTKYPKTPNNQYTQDCTGNETKNYEFESQLQFVSDAVMAYAYAFRDYLWENCTMDDKEELENCVTSKFASSIDDQIRIDGKKIKDILKNISFEGLAGNKFYFDGNGAPPRYNLIHYANTSEGYKWFKVGNYTGNGRLSVDVSALNFNLEDVTLNPMGVPESICSHPCADGYRKIVQSTNKKCCWLCEQCRNREYLVNVTNCEPCKEGSSPSKDHMRCIPSNVETVESLSVYAIACLVVAFMGVLITCSILIVFIRNNNTPIVKASGRELSYVIIFGLFMCFGMTPLMLQVPTVAICALQRFMSGFCFTIIYAGLLTKANRIARIFRSGKRTTRRPNFISPQSQIVICGLIVSVQVLIVACWLYFRPPTVGLRHPSPERTQKVCKEAVRYSYLISYIYPILLCIICTVYAIQTRHIPEAFNESKYIGVAVYTTCVIWLAFVPIYFVVMTNIPTRITSVCISTSLTAVVCQICLFFPKMYIIVFRPERNVRQAVLGPKSSSATNKNSTYMTQYRSESPSGHSDENLLEPLTGNKSSAQSRVANDYVSTGVQTSPMGTHAPLAYINSLNDGDVQL